MGDLQRVSKDHGEEAVHKRRTPGAIEKLGSRGAESGRSTDASGVARRADAVSRAPLLSPGSAHHRVEFLTNLQRSHGNAYVQRLFQSGGLQAKLTVNPPDDEFEKEADVLGEEVSRLPLAQIQRQASPEEEEEIQAQRIQRQGEEEEEPLQAKRLDRQSSPEQEEEEPVQAKSGAGEVPEVTDAIAMRIESKRGGGESIPDSLRIPLESHFGHDFSSVRLHTDAEAGELSERLEARAFTTGTDIFFRRGDYQPGSTEGRKLLGHEIAHVVQQGAAPQRAPLDEKPIHLKPISASAEAGSEEIG